MLTLDGSMGEGGGQILRTSLALSSVTGTPFRIRRIRAARPKPGLARQHLAAVRAAAEVAGAEVEGAELGSTLLTFRPRGIFPGDLHFSTEGAGSTTLVLQTVLPPLLVASAGSELLLEGGTHNPFAPPYDFLERAFAPLLRRMGAGFELELARPGFYPAGGGLFRADVLPAEPLRPLTLLDRGGVLRRSARALIAHLPRHIADRELKTAGELLGIRPENREVIEAEESPGPGNAFLIDVGCEEITEVFAGFGRRGVPAEEVARTTAEAVRDWEAAEVAVGSHLADQLLLPMALAGRGTFTTVKPTAHARTNAEVIRRFLDVDVAFHHEGGGRWRVTVAEGPAIPPGPDA